MDKPTIKQWLSGNQDDYDERQAWINKCAEHLGVTRGAVTKKAKRIWPVEQTTVPWEVTPQQESDGDIISANAFLAEIDVVDKINQFLKDTVQGNYIEAEKIRRKFDVSQTKWREISNLQLFEDNIFSFDSGGGRKKTVWSSPEGIAKLKATTSLARYAA